MYALKGFDIIGTYTKRDFKVPVAATELVNKLLLSRVPLQHNFILQSVKASHAGGLHADKRGLLGIFLEKIIKGILKT